MDPGLATLDGIWLRALYFIYGCFKSKPLVNTMEKVDYRRVRLAFRSSLA